MKLVFFLALFALVGCESEYSKRCRAGGGAIHQVNCNTTLIPNYDAEGHFIGFTYITTCDELCVGASAEHTETN